MSRLAQKLSMLKKEKHGGKIRPFVSFVKEIHNENAFGFFSPPVKI